jgi:acyl-CoA thioesterase FadM
MLFDLAHWVYEEMLLESVPDNNYFAHDQIVIPLVHAEADYLIPIKLHQKVTIKLAVDEIKTTSFQVITEFYDQSDNLSAKVKTVHVCVNKESFGKTEIPNDLRDALSKYSG